MGNSTFNKDTDIKEYRRKLIVRLAEKSDFNQTEIAEIVDCTQGYVSQVLSTYQGGGLSELKSVGHSGQKSRLTTTDLSELKKMLDGGAKAQGFIDDL